MAGISAGTNVFAALKLARRLGPGKTVVTILPDDSLQLDGVPLSRGALIDRLSAILASSAGAEERPAVIVSGDRAASLGTGISLLAELKARGVGRVSFQVSGAEEP